MRFFRIPSFTGIESHRDDADRGSLRAIEGCLPHGPGGVRSAPVWEDVGTVDMFSSNNQNMITASDDGNGNSLIFNSRNRQVTDIAIMTTENVETGTFGACYLVSNATQHTDKTGAFGPIGNRMYAIGDGTHEAIYIGKGPPANQINVFPDEQIYSLEWSRFPRCKFYVQGPNKTIFAAGNPSQPLTVYISEPAGATNRFVDSPYSTYEKGSNYSGGMLSTVDILGSKAEKITALSSNGSQVIVHTDKGCHVLYAPSADQANTGFRVEQAPSSVFSGAVSSRVVSSDNGSMIFWLGHDGQIYKDESASRGSEDAKKYTDPEQASWKSKGLWDKNHPADLSNSFAFYCPQSGYYWVFIKALGSFQGAQAPAPTTGPSNLIVTDPNPVQIPTTGPSNLIVTDPNPVQIPTTGPSNLVAKNEIFIPEDDPVFSSLTRWGYSAQTTDGRLATSHNDRGGAFQRSPGSYANTFDNIVTEAETPIEPYFWSPDGSGAALALKPSAASGVPGPELHTNTSYNYLEFNANDGEGDYMHNDRFRSLDQVGSFFAVLSSQSLTDGYIFSFANRNTKTKGQMMIKIENGTDLIGEIYSDDVDDVKTLSLLNVLSPEGSGIARFLLRFSYRYNGTAELVLNGGQHSTQINLAGSGIYDGSLDSSYLEDIFAGGYPDLFNYSNITGFAYYRPAQKSDLRIHNIALLSENSSYGLDLPNVQKYEGFLACKWGLQSLLPVNHPHKTQCPDNLLRHTTRPTSGPSNLTAGASELPGTPTNLTSEIAPDLPGAPTNLNSFVLHDVPGTPTNLTSSVLHIPGTPTNLTSSITTQDLPGTPTSLTSSVIHDVPGTPTNLTSSAAPSIPGTPTSLVSSLIHDRPGTPTDLTSSLLHDLPGTPTLLRSSRETLQVLLNFMDGAENWPEARKQQYRNAAGKLERLILDNFTLTIDVKEGLYSGTSGPGGVWAQAAPYQNGITNNGLKGNYILPFRGEMYVDDADLTLLDTHVANYIVQGQSQQRSGHYYVALHEMLHILGFGIFWNPAWTHSSNFNYQNLVTDYGTGVMDPGQWGVWPGGWQYVGTNGLNEYRMLVGTTGLNQTAYGVTGNASVHFGVPMQDGGNGGHLYYHDNSLSGYMASGATNIFGGGTGYETSYKKASYPNSLANYQPMSKKEIMSPQYEIGEELLISRVTYGILQDLGYTVDYTETDFIPSSMFASIGGTVTEGEISTEPKNCIDLCKCDHKH